MKKLLSKMWDTWNPTALAVSIIAGLFVAVISMLVVIQAIVNTGAGPYIFLSAVALFFIWVLRLMIIDNRKIEAAIKRHDQIDEL